MANSLKASLLARNRLSFIVMPHSSTPPHALPYHPPARSKATPSSPPPQPHPATRMTSLQERKVETMRQRLAETEARERWEES